MQKIKSNIIIFFKKNKEYFLSFFLCLFLILIVFLTQGVFINDKSMIVSDAQGQYYELFYYLKEVFNGTKSIFYTFNIGGGTGMFATIAYYLISPFNIIVAILPIDQLQLAMHIIIMLKIATAGLTMFILLRDEHKQTNYWILLAFSLCYCLSDYILGYEFHIMWLDALYLLPLVILGINKLVDAKKPLLYGITLFLTIMCNYYIGYMVCIFSLLYYIYRLFITYNIKQDKKKMLILTSIYIITTLCFGLMTFAIMYPTLQTMLTLDRSNYNFSFDFFDLNMTSQLYFGVTPTTFLNKYAAYLYCGVICMILPWMYFLNKHIPRRERFLSLCLLGFMILSLFFQPFYYLWHVFSSPSSFAARFSLLIIFFTILISVKAFDNIRTNEKKDYLIPLIFITLLSLYYIVDLPDTVHYWSIYITVGFAFYYTYLLYKMSLYKGAENKRIMEETITILIIVELLVNALFLFTAFDKNSYDEIDDYDDNANIMINNIDDNTFYRIQNYNYYSVNDGILNNTNSASIFLSTASSKILKAVYPLGYKGFSNLFIYSESTPVIDSLLDIKYVMSKENNFNYEIVDTYPKSYFSNSYYGIYYEDAYVLRNDSTFGIGTLTDEVSDISSYEDSYEYQNAIFKDLSGIDKDVFDNIKLTKESSNVYSFISTNDTGYYFNLHTNINSDTATLKVYFNDDLVIEYDKGVVAPTDIYYIENKYDVGENVTIRVEMEGRDILAEPLIYSFNKDNFNESVKVLKEYSMSDVEVKDCYIKGIVNVRDGKNTLYLSVPYEAGWTAYVDGKQTDINQIYNGFMSIDLSDGEHTIEFKYETPGIREGHYIALSAFVIYIIYYRYLRRRRKWN